MKLTTAETKKYALLVVKASTSGMNTAERAQHDALVVKMAKPEPRKRAKTKAATSNAQPKK